MPKQPTKKSQVSRKPICGKCYVPMQQQGKHIEGRWDWTCLHCGRRERGPIDPVCLAHGKRQSEHTCLICCLCFKELRAEQCHIRPDGSKEDVCEECAMDPAELKAWEEVAKR